MDYAKAIKQKEKEIKDLKQKQKRDRLKGYYVILADLNGNFYLNVPLFIKNHLHEQLGQDGNGMFVDTTIDENYYPKYKADSFERLNTAIEPLNYHDFLFTKNEALQYANEAELPTLIKEGIRPAENLPEADKERIFSWWFMFEKYKH